MTAAVAERAAWNGLRWLGVAALAVFIVMGAERFVQWRASSRVTSLDPATLRPGFGPANFSEALARVDEAVAGKRLLAEANATDWLPTESYVRALMARFRLTADPNDLAEADRQLTRAMALAPWPAGPSLTRATVSLTMHDLPGAEAALERFDAQVVPAPASEKMEARSIRCEIAFQRGHVALASRLCGGSDDPGMQLRLANIGAKRGATAEAAQQIEALLRRPGLPPSTVAQLALQRAAVALAAGDWDASGRWARGAERVFPGYWLSQAYVAQQSALEGHSAEAQQHFTTIAARTSNAEVMEALAAIAEARGDTDGVRLWVGRAEAVWEARMALLPQAYGLHYAEYTRLYGGSLGATYELARFEYERRPNAAVVVNYCRALLLNGQPELTLIVLRRAEADGFLTAAMKLEEYHALLALRRMDQARIARQQAYRLDPKIEDPRQRLIFFEQD